jgi:hypothetical protein
LQTKAGLNKLTAAINTATGKKELGRAGCTTFPASIVIIQKGKKPNLNFYALP